MATELPNDPLESLRQPQVAIEPRAAFATVLRHRLEEALDMSTSTVSESPTTATIDASGAATLVPYLCVDGADRAIAFYTEAFGAVETLRIAEPEGRVGHAELIIGSVTLMLSDEYPEIDVVSPTTLGGTPIALHLEVSDVDGVHARAVAAGATTVREPPDQFHGNRNAVVRDPFGHRWMLSTPVEALSAQEMADRARADGFETTTAGPRAPLGELGYWTFRVPDVDRAASFYGALLGWSFQPAQAGAAGDEHRYRHVSNTAVPMGVHDDPGSAPQTLYFRIDDLEAATARVRDLGGEVIEITDHPSGGNAKCRDDQGVEFELWKPAPGYE
jgi:uncharacterized glyoxalase superfamily protein PhnB